MALVWDLRVLNLKYIINYIKKLLELELLMQQTCLFHQYIKVYNVRVIHKVRAIYKGIFHLKMRVIQRGACYPWVRVILEKLGYIYLTEDLNGSGWVDGIYRLPNELESDLFSRRTLPFTELTPIWIGSVDGKCRLLSELESNQFSRRQKIFFFRIFIVFRIIWFESIFFE